MNFKTGSFVRVDEFSEQYPISGWRGEDVTTGVSFAAVIRSQIQPLADELNLTVERLCLLAIGDAVFYIIEDINQLMGFVE